MSSEVRRLRSVGLQTTSLDESSGLYSAPRGLEVVETGEGVVALRGAG